MKRTTDAIVMAIVVLLCPGLWAQEQPPLRSRVVLVPVDVRVVDKNGDPIVGLTSADFEVRENGVVQEIAHFAVATAGGVTMSPGNEAFEAPAAHRTFLIVLGRGDLEGPAKGLTAVRNVIASGLRPTDRVGVLAYKRATDLTTDHAAIVRLLDHYKRHYRTVENALNTWFINAGIEPKIEKLFAAPGLPTVRHLPHRFPPSDSGQLTLGLTELRRVAGDKHLIFVSERTLPGGLDALARSATDARIIVSAIGTRGSISSMRVRALGGSSVSHHTRSAEQLWAESELREFTESTGGHAFLYAHADKAIDTIERASRVRYLLGYYPTNGDMDGAYRKVTVAVKRADATVLYRHGYTARRDAPPIDDREALTHERIMAAGRTLRPPRDIGVNGSALATAVAGGTTVRVDLQIQTDKLVFATEGDRRTAAVEVAIYVGDAKQNVIGQLRKRVDVRRLLEDAQPRPVSFSGQVPVSGVPRHVKVIVYDYEGDRAGVVVLNVTRNPN